ncbi:GntR family transcriptional regulator [Sphingobium sp.]|uniref:GntR family transcriptional regulator n=1 Tax=Sphingobium sp. TaxID=1912891 RepID=UPI000DB817DF|nr:GntR family transcriptional regulator [Sphingobium sp.]PZU64573.1 MAG: GntR family transcriptional regulator [Sphingobium sp.]
MSPESVTADRIHRELKRNIVEGQFAPGGVLGLQNIARIFGTSISPVRDALNRLVGERIVELQPGGGFTVPIFDKRKAFHIYSWHAEVVRAVVKVMDRLDHLGSPPEMLSDTSLEAGVIARATSEFFTALASCSPNPEHLVAIEGLGERLHILRLHEGMLSRQAEELGSLWKLAGTGNRNATRVAMWHYHRKRLLRAGEICEAAILRAI